LLRIPNRLLTNGPRESALAQPDHLTADDLSDFLRRYARPISYGYLKISFPLSAYQTIFALHPGSAEMPSAARPFSAELVARLVAMRVIIAPITLHTGLSSQDAGEAPQPEWFEVGETTAQLVNGSRLAAAE
jgi:S-adenosylmethionine:tRNA ribosyltransferase-isomerase